MRQVLLNVGSYGCVYLLGFVHKPVQTNKNTLQNIQHSEKSEQFDNSLSVIKIKFIPSLPLDSALWATEASLSSGV